MDRNPLKRFEEDVRSAINSLASRVSNLENNSRRPMVTQMDKAGSNWLAEQEEDQTRYLNTILLIGYGGFFALWATTHGKLAPFWFGLIGTIVIISLAVFLAWEIAKAWTFGSAAKECRRKDEKGRPVHSEYHYPSIIQERYDKLNRFWAIQFLVSAALGLTALVLLLVQFLVITFK